MIAAGLVTVLAALAAAPARDATPPASDAAAPAAPAASPSAATRAPATANPSSATAPSVPTDSARGEPTPSSDAARSAPPEPAPDAATPSPGPAFVQADYDRHVGALTKRLPSADFTVVVEPPFVVVGDEPAVVVRRRSEQTVRWAVRRLKKQFFEKDPDEILTIWLFKDKASYLAHAKALFGDEPSTPYGYYSPRHKALVMNIATGAGTLVHEIVHPFMRSNFAACPAWLNEGLASLYEQSAGRGDRIVGLTNWRLAGLQAAIREGRLGAFEALTTTTDREFYGPASGVNYAQARYLCYWLQEQGLLEQFYREFVAGAADDPTGYGTLARVLGEKDMAAFQQRWQAWVLELRFP
jgi:hypothetical protein